VRDNLCDAIDTFLFVVMEYCEGGSLQDAVESRTIKEFEKATWVVQLTRGLAHIDSLRVIHRDIKPDK
jgi:serine/threonine protein kinase